MTKIIRLTRREFDARMGLVREGIANDLVNALKRRCPVATGNLRRSILYKVMGDGTIVISIAEYGIYVEFGTPPHIIRPKNGEALRFTVNNTEVFAKEVHHPGTRPQPFIRATLHLDLPKIVRENVERHLLV